MRNQETWHAANRFASWIFIVLSLALNVLQVLCFLLLPREHAFLVVGGLIVLAVILIIPITERHLQQRFGTEEADG